MTRRSPGCAPWCVPAPYCLLQLVASTRHTSPQTLSRACTPGAAGERRAPRQRGRRRLGETCVLATSKRIAPVSRPTRLRGRLASVAARARARARGRVRVRARVRVSGGYEAGRGGRPFAHLRARVVPCTCALAVLHSRCVTCRPRRSGRRWIAVTASAGARRQDGQGGSE